MKKRLTRVLNFFAFNLLFFALYLNFIHKDSNSSVIEAAPKANAKVAVVKGTTLVENPEQYLNRQTADHSGTPSATNMGTDKSTALKNSFN
jgi:hypothetical protein